MTMPEANQSVRIADKATPNQRWIKTSDRFNTFWITTGIILTVPVERT
jgi:hypothetical protein